MRQYTLEPVGLESDSKAPTKYRLYVAGEATVIAISAEEAVALHKNGHRIERCDLEALFKCSPTRKERLDRIPR
jgi:hypothetical protein